ncbi:hypothetical protein TGRH88_000160 [Toxoplasma gondii]|nr:hypothetical protein TGRH88_000160 [Toxoplasma gondii]
MWRIWRCRLSFLFVTGCLLGALTAGLGSQMSDSVGRNVQAPAGVADASQEAGDVVEERTERTEEQVFAPGPPRRHSSESLFPRNASVTARRRRNRRIALIATAVGVAVILAALYVLRRRRAQPPQEPEPPTRLRTPRPRAPSEQQQPSESEPPAEVPMTPDPLTLRFTCLGDRNVIFFGPSGRQDGFTPLYDPSPSKRVATVDAGTYGLFIGGVGMNGEFADTIIEEARRNRIPLTATELSAESQEIQERLLHDAERQPGTLVEIDSGRFSRVFARSFAYVAIVPNTVWDESETGKNVGATFLHILKPEVTPHGNEMNDVMLYTVAPFGNASDSAYNMAYKATMLGIVGAVSEYNKTPWGEVKPVEAIRLPLLGAGHFRGRRGLHSIGRANAVAVEAAITRFDPRVELQFMYEPSDTALRGLMESERKYTFPQGD